MAEAVCWYLPGALARGCNPDLLLNKEGITSACERPGAIWHGCVIPSLLRLFSLFFFQNAVSVWFY